MTKHLDILLEIGSRQFVKSHHFGIIHDFVACEGGIFIGFAQQKPSVFLGGMGFCVAGRDEFFVRHEWRFCAKIRVEYKSKTVFSI